MHAEHADEGRRGRRRPRDAAHASEAPAHQSGASPILPGQDTPATTLQPGQRWPGDTRPPFEPGNVVALRHGGTSERAIEAKAAEVRTRLFGLAPWLANEAFVPAVARFLRAEAREILLHQHIVETVATDGVDAVPQRVWEAANAAANVAIKASSVLGLDASSYARLRATTLGGDVAEQSLADLVAEGAAIRRRAGAVVAAEALDAVQAPDDTEEGADA